MKIVADENIPGLEALFGDLGRLHRLPGRTLSAADVHDADVLLVRSVTRVNEALLAGSRVRFVGTATIGTDHVDQGWLAQQGIVFASAPGCNARSVVEYVLSCLLLVAEVQGVDWRRLSVGVVGCGNVGSRLVACLRALGLTVVVNDPPQAARGMGGLEPLDAVLECDVICLHTPLVRDGEWPTWQLIDASRIARLRPHQVLISAGRGEVVDNAALAWRLGQPQAPRVILDVWAGEPAIGRTLLERVWLGTPHIAGYSLEGKVRGTWMLYEALCRHLQLPLAHTFEHLLPAPPLQSLQFTPQVDVDDAVRTAVRAVYDVRRDACRLTRTLALDEQARIAAFDQLRRDYGVRREFSSLRVDLSTPAEALAVVLDGFGFTCIQPAS